MKRGIKQPGGLISVLLDVNAEYGDRDDAAMDLGVYDDPEVEQALATVALDPTTNPELASSCGESLADIWSRKGELNLPVLKRLQGPALQIVVASLRSSKPEWDHLISAVIHHPSDSHSE